MYYLLNKIELRCDEYFPNDAFPAVEAGPLLTVIGLRKTEKVFTYNHVLFLVSSRSYYIFLNRLSIIVFRD